MVRLLFKCILYAKGSYTSDNMAVFANLSNKVTYLFRTSIAVMVLAILVIKWIIWTRHEKAESILNLSKSKDQMKETKLMELVSII